MRKATVLFIAFMTITALSACGASQQEATVFSAQNVMNAAYSDEALGLDYEVPSATPAIKVDQVGYLPGAEKRVIFTGAHTPETFDVVNLETQETVFTGTVTGRGSESAFGMFTELETEGTYFIRADVIGYSYAFTIAEDVYENALQQALKQFYLNRCGTSITEQYAQEAAHSVCHTTPAKLQEEAGKTMDVTGGWHLDARLNRTVTEGCRVVDQMLLAYELNPEGFEGKTEIPESDNEIPDLLDEAYYEVRWLLKMQDEATGGVYGAVMTDVEEGGNAMMAGCVVAPITTEATVSFASTLAHFSYLYQAYDEEVATTCLQAADKAFRLYRAAPDTAGKSGGFHAACELYRATGAKRYADVIDTYFQEGAYLEALTTDDDYFFGAVAYLSTAGDVNTEACASMMDALMNASRGIAEEALSSPYLVAGVDASSILHKMRTLAVANHILYNHEYKTIIKNHAHYLMGCNEHAVNYVTDDGEYTYAQAGVAGVRTQPLQTAQVVFLLSSMNSSGSS